MRDLTVSVPDHCLSFYFRYWSKKIGLKLPSYFILFNIAMLFL